MKNSMIVVLLITLGFSYGCKQENEIAQWRGIDRNGIFQETDLLDEWTEDSPEQLWVYEGLGRGYAAPAITKDKIFVNGEEEGKSYLYALDFTGSLLWKSVVGEEFLGEGFSSTYPGARSTPTYFNGLVYTSTGTGQLACFDAVSGDERWGVDIMKDLYGELGYFGYSESAAVDEDHVYCFPAGTENNVVALDRHTGVVAWASEVLKDTFAYGSPILVDLPEAEVMITTSRHYLFTLDRNSGDLLSSYELEGYEYDGEHCNSVIYEDGHIYFVANDIPGQGSMKLKISDDGRSITEAWRNPEVMNNFQGFVVVDDHVFATVRGNKLVSIGADGLIADSIKVATGGIAFADNKFFVYGHSGAVNMIQYMDGTMEIKGTLKVKEGSGHHFSHPVLHNGVMYIRHGDAMMAYKVGA
jgi:outer membrane protein assembly factor BamB